MSRSCYRSRRSPIRSHEPHGLDSGRAGPAAPACPGARPHHPDLDDGRQATSRAGRCTTRRSGGGRASWMRCARRRGVQHRRVDRRARQRADRVPRQPADGAAVAAYDQSPAVSVVRERTRRVPGDPRRWRRPSLASADQHPALAHRSERDAYAAKHAARAPRRSRGAERPRPLTRRRVIGLTTPGGLSGYVRGVTCAPPRRRAVTPYRTSNARWPCAGRRHACSSRH